MDRSRDMPQNDQCDAHHCGVDLCNVGGGGASVPCGPNDGGIGDFFSEGPAARCWKPKHCRPLFSASSTAPAVRGTTCLRPVRVPRPWASDLGCELHSSVGRVQKRALGCAEGPSADQPPDALPPR